MTEQYIKNLVQSYYKVELNNDTRKRHLVEARSVYFTLLRKYTRLSLAAIGKTVGRHHSSVLYNIQQLEIWFQYDKKIYADFEYLDTTLSIQVKELAEEDLKDHEDTLQRNITLKTRLEEEKQKNLELALQLKTITDKYVKLQKNTDKELLQKYGLA